MGTYIHIAEIAALLFVAYVVGWLIGYFAKRIAAGAPQTDAVIPAARLAAATGDTQPADALVKAPVVVPVSEAPPPPVPAMAAQIEPVRARVTTEGEVLVEATQIPAPEAVSGLETLKALSATMPLLPSETPPAVEDIELVEPSGPAIEPAVAATVPEPALTSTPEFAASTAEPPPALVAPLDLPAEPPKVEPAPVRQIAPLPPAMPASAPGVPWSGAMNGQEAAKFELPPAPSVELVATPPLAMTASPATFAPVALHDDLPPAPPDEPDDEPSAGLDVVLLSSLADDLKVEQPSAVASPSPVQSEPVGAASPVTAPVEPELAPVAVAAQPEPHPPAAPAHVEFDEGAAMRAIEGGWSRRASRALPDAPELTDVSAAVSAAQVAVEQVLALNGLDVAEAETRAQAAFGKPRGLGKPRDGGRDDLKQINGLSPLDESTLNNMGVYHFDQIAAWDEREVLWMENHAFARGRIGRERWQAQARDLDSRAGGVRASR